MTVHRVPDLDSLQLLLRVAAAGSLGRAAAEHGISQPAASARIRSVERQLGFAVLDRGARGSTLTPAGALVADWARQVLAAAEVMAAGVESLRDDVRGRLRVAASLTVAEHLLPRWLVRLAAFRPDVTASLAVVNSAEVGRAVLGHTADLGFVEGPSVPATLEAQVVARDELAVVVHPGHPWARRRAPLDGAELAGTRLVQREPGSGTRRSLDVALAAYPDRASPLLELSTSSAVRAAVEEGAGPAVLSTLAVAHDLSIGRLVRVPVVGVDLGRRLHAVWPRGQRPTGPARDLLAIAGR